MLGSPFRSHVSYSKGTFTELLFHFRSRLTRMLRPAYRSEPEIARQRVHFPSKPANYLKPLAYVYSVPDNDEGRRRIGFCRPYL
jgi:hypothetical protein